MQGTVSQVSTSLGGVPKYAVDGALATPHGMEGDRQNHPEFHGGLLKALLLVSEENLELLRSQGWPLFSGALGENLTIRHLNFKQIRTGQRFRVGDALIEITTPRQPCSQLNPYGKGIQREIFDLSIKQGEVDSPRYGLSGFYAAVIRAGYIRPGDTIELLEQAV